MGDISFPNKKCIRNIEIFVLLKDYFVFIPCFLYYAACSFHYYVCWNIVLQNVSWKEEKLCYMNINYYYIVIL